jgi:hypothetical protein
VLDGVLLPAPRKNPFYDGRAPGLTSAQTRNSLRTLTDATELHGWRNLELEVSRQIGNVGLGSRAARLLTSA